MRAVGLFVSLDLVLYSLNWIINIAAIRFSISVTKFLQCSLLLFSSFVLPTAVTCFCLFIWLLMCCYSFTYLFAHLFLLPFIHSFVAVLFASYCLNRWNFARGRIVRYFDVSRSVYCTTVTYSIHPHILYFLPFSLSLSSFHFLSLSSFHFLSLSLKIYLGWWLCMWCSSSI